MATRVLTLAPEEFQVALVKNKKFVPEYDAVVPEAVTVVDTLVLGPIVALAPVFIMILV